MPNKVSVRDVHACMYVHAAKSKFSEIVADTTDLKFIESQLISRERVYVRESQVKRRKTLLRGSTNRQFILIVKCSLSGATSRNDKKADLFLSIPKD